MRIYLIYFFDLFEYVVHILIIKVEEAFSLLSMALFKKLIYVIIFLGCKSNYYYFCMIFNFNKFKNHYR